MTGLVTLLEPGFSGKLRWMSQLKAPVINGFPGLYRRFLTSELFIFCTLFIQNQFFTSRREPKTNRFFSGKLARVLTGLASKRKGTKLKNSMKTQGHLLCFGKTS